MGNTHASRSTDAFSPQITSLDAPSSLHRGDGEEFAPKLRREVGAAQKALTMPPSNRVTPAFRAGIRKGGREGVIFFEIRHILLPIHTLYAERFPQRACCEPIVELKCSPGVLAPTEFAFPGAASRASNVYTKGCSIHSNFLQRETF